MSGQCPTVRARVESKIDPHASLRVLDYGAYVSISITQTDAEPRVYAHGEIKLDKDQFTVLLWQLNGGALDEPIDRADLHVAILSACGAGSTW